MADRDTDSPASVVLRKSISEAITHTGDGRSPLAPLVDVTFRNVTKKSEIHDLRELSLMKEPDRRQDPFSGKQEVEKVNFTEASTICTPRTVQMEQIKNERDGALAEGMLAVTQNKALKQQLEAEKEKNFRAARQIEALAALQLELVEKQALQEAVSDICWPTLSDRSYRYLLWSPLIALVLTALAILFLIGVPVVLILSPFLLVSAVIVFPLVLMGYSIYKILHCCREIDTGFLQLGAAVTERGRNAWRDVKESVKNGNFSSPLRGKSVIDDLVTLYPREAAKG